MDEFRKIIGGFAILFVIAVVGSIILSYYQPEAGRSYQKGVKDGYAEHCNFRFTPLKIQDSNVHYEEGWRIGLEKAITKNCDFDYYKKIINQTYN
jgi:hypothetical protein